MAFCNLQRLFLCLIQLILSFASLYFFAVSACFFSFESLSLLSNNISSSLAKFLFVASSLLILSVFLALIPDIPAASSNILLLSAGFCIIRFPTDP